MRQIVFLHGGDVKIESQVGVGTTVALILPVFSETDS
jgi:signal transduction histidine kinase